jgi:hypothetical protein
MQTGQNSIAPENSMPQLGQVRLVLVQILLSVCFGLASGLLRLYAAKTAAKARERLLAFRLAV